MRSSRLRRFQTLYLFLSLSLSFSLSLSLSYTQPAQQEERHVSVDTQTTCCVFSRRPVSLVRSLYVCIFMYVCIHTHFLQMLEVCCIILTKDRKISVTTPPLHVFQIQQRVNKQRQLWVGNTRESSP